jgi:hypothetical protein
MSAVFVQIEPEEAERIRRNPALAEMLFGEPGGAAASMAAFNKLSGVMQDRVRTMGPQMMAQALSRFDPQMRQMLEQRIGVTAESLSKGDGGNALLKMMEERSARASAMMATAQNRGGKRLDLDKEWHGIHYLLCGKAEPDGTALGEAVLGGEDLGDDDEGFSGYGPARLLSTDKVKEISSALQAPQVDASSRFDAAAMNKLKLYPGFRASDPEGLLEGLRRLRGFYAEAAAAGRAIVTCIV